MALPLSYCFGNLKRRKLKTTLIVLSIAISIMVSLLMMALSKGMLDSMRNTAEADNIVIIDANAPNIVLSLIEDSVLEVISSEMPHVKIQNNQPLISPEIYLGTFVYGNFSENGIQGVLRGIKPRAWDVHQRWNVIQGSAPKGRGVCIGKLVETKLSLPKGSLAVGKTITFENETWEIVGIFEAPGTSIESEILVDFDALQTVSGKDEVSSITAKISDPSLASEIEYWLGLKANLPVAFQTEVDFYETVAQTYKPFAALTQVMALIILLGGLFGCINTLYAAVNGRRRELATLRVLGFSKSSVFLALIIESLAITGLSGVLGGSVSLLFSGMSVRMPMGAFRFFIGPQMLLIGVGLALAIGFIGAAAPGIKALQIPAVRAIRE